MSFEEHLLEYRFFDKHLLLSSIKADWFFFTYKYKMFSGKWQVN